MAHKKLQMLQDGTDDNVAKYKKYRSKNKGLSRKKKSEYSEQVVINPEDKFRKSIIERFK